MASGATTVRGGFCFKNLVYEAFLFGFPTTTRLLFAFFAGVFVTHFPPDDSIASVR